MANILKGFMKLFSVVLLVFSFFIMNNSWLYAQGPQPDPGSIPFTCSSVVYQVLSGELFELDPNNGTYLQLNTQDDYPAINSIGFNSFSNSTQNLICGRAQADDVVHGFSVGDFVCYDSNGVIVVAVTPGTGPLPGTIAGDFDRSGNLWQKRTFLNEDLTRVNTSVDPPVWETLDFILDPSCTNDDHSVNDIAYFNIDIDNDGVNEEIFVGATISQGGTTPTLATWNLETMEVSCEVFSGITGLPTDETAFGAVFSDSLGRFLMARNSTSDPAEGTGQLYIIDSLLDPNLLARFVFPTERTDSNDGAFCVLTTFPGQITNEISVPTLSQWGLIAMAGILSIIGYMAMRRRKVAA